MQSNNAILTESQRQSYLETMGIQSYFPRYILPAAKESQRCEWPELETVPVQSTLEELPSSFPQDAQETSSIDHEPSAPEVTSESSELLQSPRGLEQADLSKVLEEVARSKEPEAGASAQMDEAAPTIIETEQLEEGARFQLTFIRVNESISIINQTPYVSSSNLSNVHRALLMNLLSAFRLSSDLQFDDSPFRWPIEGEGLDKSAAAGRVFLNAYLEQKQADGKFKTLLVMGETLADYLSVEQNNWQVINTRSLDEMLAMPLFKRDVWQGLRQFSLLS